MGRGLARVAIFDVQINPEQNLVSSNHHPCGGAPGLPVWRSILRRAWIAMHHMGQLPGAPRTNPYHTAGRPSISSRLRARLGMGLVAVPTVRDHHERGEPPGLTRPHPDNVAQANLAACCSLSL